MEDSIEILNDLDEVIRRKQQEVRERKQKQAEAEKLANGGSDSSAESDEQERTGKSVVRDENFGVPGNTEARNNADRMKLLNDLNEMIESKQREEKEAKQAKRKPKPTRAVVNRANGANSHGPITPEGKQRASANSLKHGFFANVEKLNPQDAPAYQRLLHELRHTLHPDNPVEELHIRELAMLSARLQRLEAAEYAIICSEIEAPPEPAKPSNSKGKSETSPTELPDVDSRDIAAAVLNSQDQIERLSKIETHLRRAYNRTWDRLARLQRDRRRLTPEESRKRTHQFLTYEHERTSAASSSKDSANPYDTAHDFDDDFPDLPPVPPSSLPSSGPTQEGGLPSPHGSPGSVTPKEPPSA